MALMNVLLMYMYTHVQLNLAQATCYTSYSLLILSQRERERVLILFFYILSLIACVVNVDKCLINKEGWIVFKVSFKEVFYLNIKESSVCQHCSSYIVKLFNCLSKCKSRKFLCNTSN